MLDMGPCYFNLNVNLILFQSSGPHTSYVATGLNAPPGSSITYVSPPQGAAAGRFIIDHCT